MTKKKKTNKEKDDKVCVGITAHGTKIYTNVKK